MFLRFLLGFGGGLRFQLGLSFAFGPLGFGCLGRKRLVLGGPGSGLGGNRAEHRTALAVLAPSMIAIQFACATVSSEPPEVAPRKMQRITAPQSPWQRSSFKPTATPKQQRAVLLKNARLWIGNGQVIERGYVLFKDGRITSIGDGKSPPAAGAQIIDAGGKVITPGLIDTHSHLGVYPSPHAAAHRDGNEATSPNTAEVRAIDGFWPQDPGIERAVAGGVTTIQVLPGSANLIGGRAVTLKLHPARTARAMVFPGAPSGLKMACGENPKRVYGGHDRAPSTRMGNLAGQRAAFLKARRLIDDWRRWRTGEEKRLNEFAEARAQYAAEQRERWERSQWCEHVRSAKNRRRCEGWHRKWADNPLKAPKLEEDKPPPERDPAAETLAAVLAGEILVHVHCYRADDMERILSLADDVGFKVRSFHHALEAYKLAGELSRRQIGVSTWADWWGFKLEAYDGIPENAALLERAGGRPIIHSDSPEGIQRLNQEAAKALWAGRHAGIVIPRERAIRWITQNPAWALGIDKRVGTLAAGKDADLVLWSGDPFSVYSKALRVYIDGVLRHDADSPGDSRSDFEARP